MTRTAENTRTGIDAALEDFTIHMKHKLLLTRHRPHWANSNLRFLMGCAGEELDELQAAIKSGDRKSIVREAADVANFCMMIAHNAQWSGTRAWDSHEGT